MAKKLVFWTWYFYFSSDTPSQRVQFILGTEDDDEEHIPHDLFTELDEICWREGEDAEWRETARWVFSWGFKKYLLLLVASDWWMNDFKAVASSGTDFGYKA